MKSKIQEIQPSVEILTPINYKHILHQIELAGRTCYQSDSEFTLESGEDFCKRIIKLNHLSVIEHQSITVKFENVSRAFLAQLTRHRIATFSVQSQRYVKYFQENNREFDPTIFNKIDTKEKAYFLGFLFADGNIIWDEKTGHYILSMKLQDGDDYILYYLKNLIGKPIKIIYYEKERVVVYSLGSKKIVKELIDKYGLIPKKSLIKRINKIMPYIPEMLKSIFLLGYYDGNGTIGCAKRSMSDQFCGIYCYSPKFLEELKENYPCFDECEIKNHALKFQGKFKIAKFLRYLYSNIDVNVDLFLRRKYIKALRVNEQFFITQQSKIKGSDMHTLPPEIKNNKEALIIAFNSILRAKDSYNSLIIENIKAEDARYVLPNSQTTEIVCTMNIRSWRHFFELRCDSHAQWEIRYLAKTLLTEFIQKMPALFEDLNSLLGVKDKNDKE